MSEDRGVIGALRDVLGLGQMKLKEANHRTRCAELELEWIYDENVGLRADLRRAYNEISRLREGWRRADERAAEAREALRGVLDRLATQK